MQITLAAKPMPKCFQYFLSILLFNLGCGIIYVYVMMRKITSSTERFEVVPCYSVALMMFSCGGCSLVTTKMTVRAKKCLIRSNIVLFMASAVVAIVATGATLWLLHIADDYSHCVYNKNSETCFCRFNTTSDQILTSDQYFMYEEIVGCHKLDKLSRSMIASLILNASGAFLCIVGSVNFFLALRLIKRESNATPTSSMANNNNHSDWEGWLFSHPSFRHSLIELVRGTSPPSYDETIRREQTVQAAAQIPTCTVIPTHEPPPPYSSNKNSRGRVRHYQAPLNSATLPPRQ